MNLIRATKGVLKHPSLLPHVLQGRYEFNMELAQTEFQECLTRAKALHMGMESDELVQLCGRLLGEMPSCRVAFSYPLCRQFKPEIAVETGVGSGYSSGYILQALHENG